MLRRNILFLIQPTSSEVPLKFEFKIKFESIPNVTNKPQLFVFNTVYANVCVLN